MIRNLTAILRLTFAIALCISLQTVLIDKAFPAETKAADKSAVTVIHVPTTGTILDVSYMPEFEEWWIKCREGDKIVVYSYERLSKNWRRVIFEVKKPDATPTAEKPRPSADVSSPAATEKVEAPKKEGTQHIEGPETKRKDAAPEKKKFWDPVLNIFKQK